ncbi:Phosphatase dcr2 [Vanrija albida]|uniref:Phosphatase dcr2 n=1 Tax=Vanrija albida TaxID=181172 RepID=A0ABR3QEZ4_9TREE
MTPLWVASLIIGLGFLQGNHALSPKRHGQLLLRSPLTPTDTRLSQFAVEDSIATSVSVAISLTLCSLQSADQRIPKECQGWSAIDTSAWWGRRSDRSEPGNCLAQLMEDRHTAVEATLMSGLATHAESIARLEQVVQLLDRSQTLARKSMPREIHSLVEAASGELRSMMAILPQAVEIEIKEFIVRGLTDKESPLFLAVRESLEATLTDASNRHTNFLWEQTQPFLVGSQDAQETMLIHFQNIGHLSNVVSEGLGNSLTTFNETLKTLYLPTRSSFGLFPVAGQQLGWQSWDVVDQSTGTQPHNSSAGSSLRLDIWDPSAAHTTGLTEIRVQHCMISPHILPSFCEPDSTPEDDMAKGKWVRVDVDLNQRAGIWHLYVYYRRTRRLDVPLIADLRIAKDLSEEGWTKAHGDLHSGVFKHKKMHLWYKLQTQEPTEGPRQEIITEVDVLFGDDAPFYGFHRVDGGKVLDAKEGKWESVDLVYRRGTAVPAAAPEPRFHSNGTFKVLQIADLHYSVGQGKCRDTDKTPCVGDKDTEEWLGQALDAERPDLVVFSGDQLNGQKTSYNARSVLAKFAKPVIDRKIAWAAVFGNHDSEIADDRAEQMRAMQQMPYSLCQTGPADVDGVGNYDIRVHSGDVSRNHIFTLFFLDSHAYQKSLLPWKKLQYDYIKPSQIDWFVNVSMGIKPIERPFRPNGAEDIGKVWTAKRRLARQTMLARPNAMMFFHIPLPEAYLAADRTDDKFYPSGELDLGSQLDREGASNRNGGFFGQGIKHSFEIEEGGESAVTQVKVLSHGHCHMTDRCRRVDGVWMCFDGGSSFSGYGKEDFDRRTRVYLISQWGEVIETYKRLTSGDVVDKQVLVGEGAASGWGQSAQ